MPSVAALVQVLSANSPTGCSAEKPCLRRTPPRPAGRPRSRPPASETSHATIRPSRRRVLVKCERNSKLRSLQRRSANNRRWDSCGGDTLDRLLLVDAVRQLEQLGTGSGNFASEQGVRQFNALLDEAKTQFHGRHDVQALSQFERTTHVDRDVFRDAVVRLLRALELRPPAAVAAFLAEVTLPENAAGDIAGDVAELREAAALGLARTTLLLSGLIAEALLLSRHPDVSEHGPGLAKLVALAKTQKLFGRDTLRQLETLVDYRDLIHPRAGVRNGIQPNEARIESALTALRLLCSELEDPTIVFET